MLDFKILALNLDIQWKNPHANRQQIEALLQETTADLYLLPEMFTTGFCMDAEAIADSHNETLQWMQNWAEAKQAALCGSVSIKENHQFYNRCFFVMPDRRYVQYDKRHLFSYSGEDQIYTAGKERVVVDYQGVRFLLQICYDLRFPVFSRNQNDYDVALYLSNWPRQRIEAWQHLLKARAIENQAYVFGVNRIGTDGNGLHYPESTYAYAPDGRLVSEQNGTLVSASIDKAFLQRHRAQFPFLGDADAFTLKI